MIVPPVAKLKEYWLRSEYERVKLKHKRDMAHIQEMTAHYWSRIAIAVGGSIAFIVTILKGR